VVAGLFDVTATALLVVGVRNDLAVVVAPLAALAPGFTVVLAWLVLDEPISRPQTFGLGLALVGLVLIAAG
jgi:drug/metabolite transporter (DMT)-like permease